MTPPVVLTVAGTDSGGGAGIAADLATFAALDAHGACVVTAVTAQDTTGVSAIHPVPAEIVAAQLDAVLDDLAPAAATIGFLVHTSFPTAAEQVGNAEQAARAIGARIHVLRADNEREIDAAFETMAKERIRALAVAPSPFFDVRRRQIIALAARHAVPAIYHFREYAVDGGLVSYGVDVVEMYRQLGLYAGQVLL